ncbi:intein N-terminal splicing region [Sebaldella termitidis]|uniref:Hedgehog/intein hint domain protein n=1 Tax=Sebaldella termitidis (strain ATCC 33386 / NCTC 11300) TaxID=526218 RepID=D1AMU3_SEBTE|nr:polymorphic toxin-type HINT domain-containing protein [Sebaldella termitidis]ACZ07319.1 Hedgehog/intein hint domain protein [Sebaldella termitidis ATCC 33386]SUI22611.1 intein N-terminal splicing region [Sebaldella termitidis]
MGEIKFEEVFVCHQAYIYCPFGEFIQPVEATVNETATFQGKRVLTKDDDVVGRNIHPFKKCDKKGECLLSGTVSWQKARTDIKVNGSRLLTGESYFMCPHVRGTKIEFKDVKQEPGPEVDKRSKLEIFTDEASGLMSALMGINGVFQATEGAVQVKKRYENIYNATVKDVKYFSKDNLRTLEEIWSYSLPGQFTHGDPYSKDMKSYIKNEGIFAYEEGEEGYSSVTGSVLSSMALDVIHPAYGAMEDAYDFKNAYNDGDKLGMALSAVGFIPVLGAGIKKGTGKAMKIAGESKMLKKGSKIGDAIVDSKAVKLFQNTLSGKVNKVVRGFGDTLKSITEAGLNLKKRFVSSTKALNRKINMAICNLIESGCFVGGTLVNTEYGLKKIENIKIGEKVYTYDLVNREVILKEVTETFNERVSKIIKIEIENNVIIETTVEHPFYVKDIGWVEAGKLKEGDKLFSRELGDTEIAAVREDIYLDRDVYNLQLEGNHNFFVSELELLVHNDTACAELLKKLDDDIAKLIKEGASEDVINSLRKQRKHIIEKNLNEFLNGTKKFDDVLDDYARLYADVVDSNEIWRWERDMIGGSELTARQRKAIRTKAFDDGLLPIVEFKAGTKYPDFEKAGLIIKEDMLPEELWKASDRRQFDWLDNRLVDGRPRGTTWNHSDIAGRMELVPFGIHNVINHRGGRSPGQWAYVLRR